MTEYQDQENSPTSQSPKAIYAGIAICVLVLIGVIYWFFNSGSTPEQEQSLVLNQQQESQSQTQEGYQPQDLDGVQLIDEYQNREDIREVTDLEASVREDKSLDVAEIVEEKPASSLEEKEGITLENSTSEILKQLQRSKINTSPFNNQNLIRNFVAFVDNVANGALARDSAVIQGPHERFKVTEKENKAWMDTANYARYDAIVDWFTDLEPTLLARIYSQYEPLFNEAYAEISRPDGQFIDRLQEAIAHIQETPLVEGAIELDTQKVMYRYQDPALESLSSVQKQMLRMGPDNIARVNAKLAQLFQALERL